jgi:hypothetical protein
VRGRASDGGAGVFVGVPPVRTILLVCVARVVELSDAFAQERYVRLFGLFAKPEFLLILLLLSRYCSMPGAPGAQPVATARVRHR